ncbi:MAG TPA: Gfo/Idh/MocA family oxidoreductase [Bryobacteraceae bacterium]|nr:Gfo/Idh/MocA family oxidoreductase [Bryobacteraceae bacterium]
MTTILRGGMVGCGFFAQHHLEAWRRIPEAEIVAVCDVQMERARGAAPRAYASVEEMLEREDLDFLDIVTRDESHLHLVQLAVARKIPIICQKPIAADWNTAKKIVEIAEAAGVRLMIHENWRWQPWHRVAGESIRRGDIGPPISYGFRTRRRDGIGDAPYPLQSYFREMPRLLIHETLVHHIDTARFLFDDLAAVYAQARRRNPRIAGEDQALLVLTHRNCVQGWIDGHRFLDAEPDSPLIGEAFFEGEHGCLSILPGGDVYLDSRLIWKNDVTAGYRGDSVRATQMHFISCLRDGTDFETGGREYLLTFAAVEAAYRSIAERRQVSISEVCCPEQSFHEMERI